MNQDYRVKVFLSKETYEALINDMNIFEFRNNTTINKSGFLNQLFANYHQIYNEKINTLLHSFDSNISNYIINSLKKFNLNKNELSELEKKINTRYKEYIKKNMSNNPDEYEELLSFKINKNNQETFEDIMYNQFLPNDTIASYFRSLFDSYATLSQDIRETIIFKNTFSKIEKAINKLAKIRIKNHLNQYFLISPYYIAQTIEENHNYVIGVDDLDRIYTFKLCQIKEVIITNDEYIYNPNIMDTIEKLIINGAQYSIDDYDKILVKLTPVGKNLFENIIYNRPHLINIDNDIYEFYCSKKQIIDYFIQFSNNATILTPNCLRNEFLKLYEVSYYNYKKKDEY